MKTLTIDIRKAKPHDAAAIADVHLEAWQGAYAGIIPHKSLTLMINRRGSDWWANAIHRTATVLVLEIGGVIAGYATIGRNRARKLPQQGEIYELYLRPEYQGIGLGSRLFAAARSHLTRYGMKGLVVWVLEENTNALAFYAGAGGKDMAEGVEVFEHRALKKIAFIWD
ncbi:GNAT family N-acetyltransferase [Aquamicrobium segne]|uniref:GNAT family N-acetyltransferase n=1 Tax=Aquamicrobium segne TaxID=469547 RepID=A0ABW0H0B1_9HYPH